MTRLPVVSGREVIAALQRIGYIVVRQRGSHVRMRHRDDLLRIPVTVPDHRELKPGTLAAILRDVGITANELRELI